ncbi:hypothetical protein PsYK624_093950 [Phanerochaete sordida]|uniref:Uncharacterized protein n=1 Tax=Phanerochaete sordida TaxID=48140 RepID=A0A9P3LF61_9APHY|nr:hypothetical protein PsYK624_093950 [Phanerochaete sordida]
MPFPFSFVFSVPGIANPFTPTASSPAPGSPQLRPPSPASTSSRGTKKPKLGMNGIFSRNRPSRADDFQRRPPPVPSLEPPPPTARKRGWVPSHSEPSIPTTFPATVQTSTSGHLGPSTSINMKHPMEQHDEDDMEGDLPPPKRRKTLAGSIVSTALSAALIGTAVGLTVYRIWKGKGKQTETPPPPYEQGEWNTSPSPDPCEYPDPSVTSSAHRRRQQRHVAGRRTLPRQRKPHSRTGQTYANNINFTPPQHPTHSSVPPQFNFGSPDPSYEEEPEADESDQMDWIGDRLAKLIEEGKRALGKEIVVAAETEEDQEDDGSGQWVEDEDHLMASSSSGSISKSRGRRPRAVSIASPPPQYTSPQHTPRTPNKNRFDPISRPSSTYSSPRGRGRADSVDSAASGLAGSQHDDSAAFMSPEIREAMERARQSYLQRRQMAS